MKTIKEAQYGNNKNGSQPSGKGPEDWFTGAVGGIGMVGMAPAIANAVFNATGKRIRNLPITPDKLI